MAWEWNLVLQGLSNKLKTIPERCTEKAFTLTFLNGQFSVLKILAVIYQFCLKTDMTLNLAKYIWMNETHALGLYVYVNIALKNHYPLPHVMTVDTLGRLERAVIIYSVTSITITMLSCPAEAIKIPSQEKDRVLNQFACPVRRKMREPLHGFHTRTVLSQEPEAYKR